LKNLATIGEVQSSPLGGFRGLQYLMLVSLIIIIGCGKKHLPQTTVDASKIVTKGPWPKTLTVNDKAAKKAVDGRLYYDLEGKRYWKNYKDGKYYLFNQSMYNDPAFKAPGK
jgi:hypothetical protein